MITLTFLPLCISSPSIRVFSQPNRLLASPAGRMGGHCVWAERVLTAGDALDAQDRGEMTATANGKTAAHTPATGDDLPRRRLRSLERNPPRRITITRAGTTTTGIFVATDEGLLHPPLGTMTTEDCRRERQHRQQGRPLPQ